eukprot:scaffold6226_cov118-Cylindrotheca_fusiformis.AAC.6
MPAVPFIVSFVILLSYVWTATTILLADASTNTKKEEQKAFRDLVRAIEYENGGFVHPSIGLIAPAPNSGASRGLGIVKNIKKSPLDNNGNDVLIKVPYSYQMTRELALTTLTDVIPPTVLVEAPLYELDDAALLVLLLVHEYGLGKKSKFYPYIQTLPLLGAAGCGWWTTNDEEELFRGKLPAGVHVEDVKGALNYVHLVSHGMADDYASYLAQSSWPFEWKKDPALAIQWALCIVSSRGTAASSIAHHPGEEGTGGDPLSSGVRLVPLADLANHWKASGGFIELSGRERIVLGDFMDAVPNDSGAFVIRSIWKCGTTRELSVGDEITVNYNLPEYNAVDWFLSLGFVPTEVQEVERQERNGSSFEKEEL